MQNSHVEKLKSILHEVQNIIPKNDFCGVGLVVYSEFRTLPVLSLYPRIKITGIDLIEQIINASRFTSDCHDGFHFISNDWKLTHRNQYFAPPIPADLRLTDKGNFGARYVSALLGSLLPNVICTGIVSERDGVVVFEDGKNV